MRTVAVLAGGTSSEHEVSCWSGQRVFDGLDRRRYRPLNVLIEPDGDWVVNGIRRRGPLGGIDALLALGCDVAFLALHGPFGEDGTIQGFLETVGLAYTGSGVAGSALAADKVRTKQIVAASGIEVAPDLLVPPSDPAWVQETLGFPVYVKNPYGGSSLEVRRAETPDELMAALHELCDACDRLLVEGAIPGRELTVAVLADERGAPQALPVAEVRSDGDYFDFKNKYTAGVAEEIVPAPVPSSISRRIEETALRIHELVGLRAMSRTDFILRPDGTPVFLEINPIPGLTPNSLLPKAAAAVGLSFPDVLTRLVEVALSRAARSRIPAWSGSFPRSGARSTGSSTASTAARSSS